MAACLDGARRPMRTAGAADPWVVKPRPFYPERRRLARPSPRSGHARPIGPRMPSSGGSCDHAADARTTLDPSVARGARGRRRPRWRWPRRRSPTAPSRSSRRPPASLLLGWTFEPLPTLGLAAVTVWWLWAVRRVNAVHPANPVPRRRTVAFLAGIAGPGLRAAVGDRPLRHRAVLDPHGPARAADAGRGAAARAGRADHPRPAAELVGDPPPLDPAGPPLAGRAVPRPSRSRPGSCSRR